MASICKKTIQTELDYDKVLDLVIRFIGEPFTAVVHEREFFGKWDSTKRKWV